MLAVTTNVVSYVIKITQQPLANLYIYLAELLLCSYHFQKYYQLLDLLRIQLILQLLQPFIEGLDFKGSGVVFVIPTLEGSR